MASRSLSVVASQSRTAVRTLLEVHSADASSGQRQKLRRRGPQREQVTLRCRAGRRNSRRASTRRCVRTCVRAPAHSQMPKGDQPGWRPHTYERTDSRTHVRALARSSCVHGEKLRMLCQYVVPLLQVVPVVPCVPVVPGGVRTLRTCTYVRTHVRISVCTQVRTYVRSSQRRVLCARCARSRQYVRYVRAHVRSSHSRVMCASCARSRKCVRTYVRTYFSNPRNERAYVRTYVCQLS